MPFYYDLNFETTTNGTANQLSFAGTFASDTGGSGKTLRLIGMIVDAHLGIAVGALRVRVNCGVDGSLIAAPPVNLTPRHPDNPASSSLGELNQSGWNVAPTSIVQRLSLGADPLGGTAAWAIRDADHGIALKPKAAVVNSMEIQNISQVVSVTYDQTLEFAEDIAA